MQKGRRARASLPGVLAFSLRLSGRSHAPEPRDPGHTAASRGDFLAVEATLYYILVS